MDPGQQHYPYFKCSIPEGEDGLVRIERFEVRPLPDGIVDPSGAANWAKRRPGLYSVLVIDGVRMMTDLYEEWWSQREAIEKATSLGGHVHISGLGLGLIIDSILMCTSSKVERVTVVESNASVICLVAPTLQARYGDRIQIIHRDIFEYQPDPSSVYSVVWHDIWPNPATVPSDEIADLKAKFNDICQWQGFWTSKCYI